MHKLTEVDAERETATCSVCGPDTRIWMFPSGRRACTKGASSRLVHRLSDVDREAGWATCSECGPVTLRYASDGSRIYCSYSVFLHRSKANARTFGGYKPLTAPKAELDARILEQQGRCAICSAARPDLVPDHCHDTGRFRGWICPNCNSGGGMFKDDPDLLEAAAAFFRR